MRLVPWVAAWAIMVFPFGRDPVLAGLILAVLGAFYWWFVQCRGI